MKLPMQSQPVERTTYNSNAVTTGVSACFVVENKTSIEQTVSQQPLILQSESINSQHSDDQDL